MQAKAAVRGRPVRFFAGGDVHARQPVFSREDGMLRVLHVDCDQDVVGEAVEQRRGVGPATADIPDAMQARALDRHEADLPRFVRFGNVIDRHPRRPIARRGLRLGVVIDGALVIALLVGEFGLREHVLVVHHEQQVAMGLQMQRPGIRRRRDKAHGLGRRGIADIDDGEALGEDVADIGVAAMHHDLDAVAAAVLVAVADEPHVAGGVVGFDARGAGHCFVSMSVSRLGAAPSPLAGEGGPKGRMRGWRR